MPLLTTAIAATADHCCFSELKKDKQVLEAASKKARQSALALKAIIGGRPAAVQQVDVKPPPEKPLAVQELTRAVEKVDPPQVKEWKEKRDGIVMPVNVTKSKVLSPSVVIVMPVRSSEPRHQELGQSAKSSERSQAKADLVPPAAEDAPAAEEEAAEGNAPAVEDAPASDAPAAEAPAAAAEEATEEEATEEEAAEEDEDAAAAAEESEAPAADEEEEAEEAPVQLQLALLEAHKAVVQLEASRTQTHTVTLEAHQYVIDGKPGQPITVPTGGTLLLVLDDPKLADHPLVLSATAGGPVRTADVTYSLQGVEQTEEAFLTGFGDAIGRTVQWQPTEPGQLHYYSPNHPNMTGGVIEAVMNPTDTLQHISTQLDARVVHKAAEARTVLHQILREIQEHATSGEDPVPCLNTCELSWSVSAVLERSIDQEAQLLLHRALAHIANQSESATKNLAAAAAQAAAGFETERFAYEKSVEDESKLSHQVSLSAYCYCR